MLGSYEVREEVEVGWNRSGAHVSTAKVCACAHKININNGYSIYA